MTTFSEQLIKLRTAKNLSQEQLADKIYVSRQAVSKWEKALSTPDLDKIVLLAKTLGVSLDELVLGKEPKPEKKHKDWFHVDNGWEFVAKFWWIIIALAGALASIFK